MAVYADAAGTLIPIDCGQQVDFAVNSGETYRFLVAGQQGASGPITFEMGPPPH